MKRKHKYSFLKNQTVPKIMAYNPSETKYLVNIFSRICLLDSMKITGLGFLGSRCWDGVYCAGCFSRTVLGSTPMERKGWKQNQVERELELCCNLGRSDWELWDEKQPIRGAHYWVEMANLMPLPLCSGGWDMGRPSLIAGQFLNRLTATSPFQKRHLGSALHVHHTGRHIIIVNKNGVISSTLLWHWYFLLSNIL